VLFWVSLFRAVVQPAVRRFGHFTAPALAVAACCFGASAAFQICLLLSRGYETLRGFTLYRCFEDNSYRIYLFHMPGAYIVFRMLDALGMTAPLPFIMLSFTLNFCITLVLVRGINALEKRLLHAVKNRGFLRNR
jgi:peptidoglycan/LPS O-acetylase OafA/YrhL